MIQISSISDCHIRKSNDAPSMVLKKFLQHPHVEKSTHILFLGDIFDYCVGNHKEYLTYYHEFFEAIAMFVQNGKQVIFIEGNHDFHLEEVFNELILKFKLSSMNFRYIKNSYSLKIGSYDVLAMHGDQLDYNNESYKKWKKIYTSNYFKFILDHILNFEYIQKIGNWASSDSKKRNKKNFIMQEARDKYRKGAGLILENQTNTILLAGHTHICDEFKIKSNLYINSGYPLNDESFVVINTDGAQLVKL